MKTSVAGFPYGNHDTGIPGGGRRGAGYLGPQASDPDLLTEETGIPIATMSRRLNAQSAFTIDELVSIAQALEVPLGEVLAPITNTAAAVAA